MNNKSLKHFISAVAGLLAVAMGLIAIRHFWSRRNGNAGIKEKGNEKKRNQNKRVSHRKKTPYRKSVSGSNGKTSLPVKAADKDTDGKAEKSADRADRKNPAPERSKDGVSQNDTQNDKKYGKTQGKASVKKQNGRDHNRQGGRPGKKRLKHSLMAAAAATLALTLAAVSVLTRSIEAEAAETFFGIEKLRNQIAESEREYTVLEIVPNRNASEIGYLFGGYEPILSAWDKEEMKWVGWKEILCSLPTFEERKAFIEGKKKELQAYYDSLGLKDKFPVTYGQAEYEESETAQEGFERCEADGQERTGWFEKKTGGAAEGYRLTFDYQGTYSQVNKEMGFLYYIIDSATLVTADMVESMAPETVIYKKLADGIFVDPKTWAEMLEEGINVAGETETETETETVTEEKTTDKETKEEETTGTTQEDTTGDGTQETGTQGETGTGDGSEGTTGTGPQETGSPAETSNPGGGETVSPEPGSTVPGSPEESSSNLAPPAETGSDPAPPVESSSSPASPSESSGGGTPDTPQQDPGDQNGGQPSEPENAGSELTWNGRVWDRLSAEVKPTDASGADPQPPADGGSPQPGAENPGGNTGTPEGGGTPGGNTGTPEDGGNPGGNTGTPEGGGTPEESSSVQPGTGAPEESSTGGNAGTPEESGSEQPGTSSPEESGGTETETATKPESETKVEPTTETDDEIKTDQAGSEAGEDGYYILSFKRVENYGNLAGDTHVYIVSDIAASAGGEYQFIESDDENQNKQTYYFAGTVIYCRNAFTNNEWFKKYVLNMEPDDFEKFPVKVVTLTPGELNNMGEPPVFDFLYINSGMRTSVIDEITGEENKPGGSLSDIGHAGIGKGTDNGNGNDAGSPGNGEGAGGGNGAESGNGEGTGGGNGAEPGNGEGTGGGNDAEPGNGEGAGNGNDTEPGSGEEAGNGNGAEPGSGEGTGNEADREVGADLGNGGDLGGEQTIGTVNSDTTRSGNGMESGTGEGTGGESGTNAGSGEGTDVNPGTGSDAGSPGNDGAGNTNPAEGAGGGSGTNSETGEGTGSESGTNPGSGEGTGGENGTESGEGAGSEISTDTGNEDGTGPENDGNGTEPGTGGSTDSAGTGNENADSTLSGDQYAADSCDLSESMARSLFERIVAGALPCLVDGGLLYRSDENDGTVVNAGQKNTWIFKFAAVMCQESLPAWLEEHTSGISGISVDTLLEEMVEDDDHNFTTEQVYCKFGTPIINSNFFTPTIYTEGAEIEQGFQNVLDEIELENLFRTSDTSGNYAPLPTNISQAEALRHIINYKNRRSVETKKHIKVLEIQPAKVGQSDITLEQLQKWAPGVESVDITVMTTAEFIGKIEKLNETYDLIYIGTSKEHLNLKNWITDNGKSSDGKYLGSTVFNDHDMDGLIYYNIGDLRVVNLPLSGLLTTEYKNNNRSDYTYFYNYVRYGGNDITEEKMRALTSFLDGAYPVIVSDEFIEQPATLFEDVGFKGRRGTVGTGEFEQKALLERQIYAKLEKKGISSLKVKDGYRVTLYDQPDLKGNSVSFNGDVADLSKHSWDNRCQSVKVEKLEEQQTVREVDGDHIDNCTYLYEFVDSALEKGYTNFYAEGDIDENGSELFKFYLNRPKVSMSGFTANGATEGILSDGTVINDVYYINPNMYGKYTLSYSFAIQNEGAASMDTQYSCKLYIDVNADGKFSQAEEVSDITMTNRQNGSLVSADGLYAGTEYTLTREVPMGYKGLLPWRIEICQVNNPNIYTSANGYTKLKGMEKEVLKICQINRNTDRFGPVISLQDEVSNKSSFFHILIYGGYHNGIYYPGIADDFELDIKTISVWDFENYTNPDRHHKDYNPNYLKDFNMLILGFSDLYGDFSGDSQSGPMGAIIDFINSGKSVMLGHDTTSFFNNPSINGQEKGYLWRNSWDARYMPASWYYTSNAVSLNRYVRPLVGMDRYGILQSPVLQRGVALKEGEAGWNEVVSGSKDVAYKPKSGRKETVAETHGYTYSLISAKNQKVEKDPGTSSDNEYTQYNLWSGNWGSGIKIVFTNQYRNIRYDNCYYWDDKFYDHGEMERVNNGEVSNIHVTQVNKGQITEYPYKLAQDFEVAQTHGQYYELDYTADDDMDGQSDLVVWFCLGERVQPGSMAKLETVYSQSPNDVRNNYYIYNKGNITYTGMGHSAKHKNSGGTLYTFDEAKLFINTMIASYQAGMKSPYISVLENGLPEAREIKTIYRFYDDANGISLSDEATADANEKLYFTVQDVNFVKGSRSIATHVFYEAADGSETITVSGTEKRVNRLVDAMYNASDDSPVDANNLRSGGIYYILVPKSVMRQCDNGLKFYFEAQSTITTNTTTANVYVTDKIYAELEVLKAYLFELE